MSLALLHAVTPHHENSSSNLREQNIEEFRIASPIMF